MSMKVAILAGGLGTRLQEETIVKPKPMVNVGGKPMIWHIMKIYASYGFKEFVIALGYKGEVVKDYFLNYRYYSSSLTVRLKNGEVLVRDDKCEEWTIHLLDTGLHAQTGDRVRCLANFIGYEAFMLTYGDGVASLDIASLVDFHIAHGKLATVTAVRPPARFGGIDFEGDLVARFQEKPQIGEGWINGGFFVLEPGVIDFIQDCEDVVWEREPMEKLACAGQLAAYRHEGFWQCMDTLRDVHFLESLWQSNQALWKVW